MGLGYSTKFLAYRRHSINGSFCSYRWTKNGPIKSEILIMWPICPVPSAPSANYYQVYVGSDSFPIMQLGGMTVGSLSCLCWETWKTQQGHRDAYAPDGKPNPESQPEDEMDSRYCSQVPRTSVTFVLPKAWFFSFLMWFLFPPNKPFHLI